jgi:NADH-quinone oxidoreductase subunit H
MPRFVSMLFAIAVILGVIFGLTAVTYAVAAGAEHLFAGAGRLTNILFLMLVFVMVMATLLTLAERKWSALMQNRVGPNRARFFFAPNSALLGIPHVIADALKMLFKEDFAPATANKFLFNLGPILAFVPVFVLFAIVPVAPTIHLFDRSVALVVATPDFGLLYVLALASLAVYGTALAGWASNNKFALLGGVRASSQMISYEVALGLSLVGVMIAFSTVQLPVMTDAQSAYLWRFEGWDFGLPAWGIFLQPIGFILFFAAAFAETKRAPFDVPEGESEIIGYFVEYSGMKFGMFMIAEFVEVVVLSGVIAAIFFGGYHLPFGEAWLGSKEIFANHPWLWGSFLGTVFWVKVLILCWLQLAIRWTFPRFRYDQIQTLGWKMLLPAGLVNLFISGALILWDPSLRYLALAGIIEIGILLALTLSRAGGHIPASHAASHGGHGHGHAAPAVTSAAAHH